MPRQLCYRPEKHGRKRERTKKKKEEREIKRGKERKGEKSENMRANTLRDKERN